MSRSMVIVAARVAFFMSLKQVLESCKDTNQNREYKKIDDTLSIYIPTIPFLSPLTCNKFGRSFLISFMAMDF